MSPAANTALVKVAELSDAEAIHEITHEAFVQYARELGLPRRVKALYETLDDVKRDIENKHVFLAVVDGQPMGSIRYEVLECGVAYISRFGVKTTLQKNGVGRALVGTVAEECFFAGVPAIALHTSAKMRSLVRFYYGQDFYIRSTETSEGYVRALFIRELVNDGIDYGLKLLQK